MLANETCCGLRQRDQLPAVASLRQTCGVGPAAQIRVGLGLEIGGIFAHEPSTCRVAARAFVSRTPHTRRPVFHLQRCFYSLADARRLLWVVGHFGRPLLLMERGPLGGRGAALADGFAPLPASAPQYIGSGYIGVPLQHR